MFIAVNIIQHCIRGLASCQNNKNVRERNKSYLKIGKEIKLSLLTDEIICLENWRKSTENYWNLESSAKYPDAKLLHKNQQLFYKLAFTNYILEKKLIIIGIKATSYL